jgi:flagellar biosynthesis protein FlhG
VKDQASALRNRPHRQEFPEIPAESPAIIVGGGKGGVGVSVLATLLASGLARSGARVLLMDATLNQGNLHVLLGASPTLTLESVLSGEASPEDLVMPVSENLWLLPAASGAERVHALTPMDRARLQVRLAGVMDAYDVTVVDAGTGIEGVLRATLTRSTRVVAVTSPEPAALADTYALVKILSHEAPTIPVDLVVNRTFDAAEGEAACARLTDAAARFLGRSLGSLGSVAEDVALARAVRHAQSLLDHDVRVAPIVGRLLECVPSTVVGGRVAS